MARDFLRVLRTRLGKNENIFGQLRYLHQQDFANLVYSEHMIDWRKLGLANPVESVSDKDATEREYIGKLYRSVISGSYVGAETESQDKYQVWLAQVESNPDKFNKVFLTPAYALSLQNKEVKINLYELAWAYGNEKSVTGVLSSANNIDDLSERFNIAIQRSNEAIALQGNLPAIQRWVDSSTESEIVSGFKYIAKGGHIDCLEACLTATDKSLHHSMLFDESRKHYDSKMHDDAYTMSIASGKTETADWVLARALENTHEGADENSVIRSLLESSRTERLYKNHVASYNHYLPLVRAAQCSGTLMLEYIFEKSKMVGIEDAMLKGPHIRGGYADLGLDFDDDEPQDRDTDYTYPAVAEAAKYANYDGLKFLLDKATSHQQKQKMRDIAKNALFTHQGKNYMPLPEWLVTELKLTEIPLQVLHNSIINRGVESFEFCWKNSSDAVRSKFFQELTGQQAYSGDDLMPFSLTRLLRDDRRDVIHVLANDSQPRRFAKLLQTSHHKAISRTSLYDPRRDAYQAGELLPGSFYSEYDVWRHAINMDDFTLANKLYSFAKEYTVENYTGQVPMQKDMLLCGGQQWTQYAPVELALENGSTNMLDWLWARYSDNDLLPNLFHHACLNNNMPMLDWIWEHAISQEKQTLLTTNHTIENITLKDEPNGCFLVCITQPENQATQQWLWNRMDEASRNELSAKFSGVSDTYWGCDFTKLEENRLQQSEHKVPGQRNSMR